MMILGEMDYKCVFIHPEVLAFGFHKGHRYWAVNRGFHPCCYVELLKNDKGYKRNYDEIDLWVHGRLTYGSNVLDDITKDEGCFIGWDYGHCGDYSGAVFGIEDYPSVLEDHPFHALPPKKWTSEELEQDCKDAIDQLRPNIWE